MLRISLSNRVKAAAVVLSALTLAGCGTVRQQSGIALTSRECMARVMYFESNRSSDDGMLAVGTVVMNRANSGRYPRTVCGVVGQPNQFAPGVLTRRMTDSGRPRAYRMADAVLRGARHPGVGSKSMFFHTAGYKFPYRNMHYVTIAGGNAFYEKRKPGPGVMIASQESIAARVQVASVETRSWSRPSEPIWSEPVEPRRPYLAQREVKVARADDPERERSTRRRRDDVPLYEAPREIQVARAELPASQEFSDRPVRDDVPVYEAPRSERTQAKPAPYGYDAGRGRFEARPERGSVDDYALRASAPVTAAESPAPAERRRRSVDPTEGPVMAAAAPVRREPRPRQAPRSIEELIDAQGVSGR